MNFEEDFEFILFFSNNITVPSVKSLQASDERQSNNASVGNMNQPSNCVRCSKSLSGFLFHPLTVNLTISDARLVTKANRSHWKLLSLNYFVALHEVLKLLDTKKV